jgi:hypothetical protein
MSFWSLTYSIFNHQFFPFWSWTLAIFGHHQIVATDFIAIKQSKYFFIANYPSLATK